MSFYSLYSVNKLTSTGGLFGNQIQHLPQLTKSSVYKTKSGASIVNFHKTTYSLKKALNLITKIVSKKGFILIYMDTSSNLNQLTRYTQTNWHGGYLSNYRKSKHSKRFPSFLAILSKKKKIQELIARETKQKDVPSCSILPTTMSPYNVTYPIFLNFDSVDVKKINHQIFNKAVVYGILQEIFRIKKRKRTS